MLLGCMMNIRKRHLLQFLLLVLVDLDSPHSASRENVSYFCGWSPFEGDTFNSRVVSTFVNGNLVYSEGRILESNQGVQLEFDR